MKWYVWKFWRFAWARRGLVGGVTESGSTDMRDLRTWRRSVGRLYCRGDWIVRRISPGEMIPRGYGIAWGYGRARAVCLPWGINLIAAAIHWLYWCVATPEVLLGRATLAHELHRLKRREGELLRRLDRAEATSNRARVAERN